MCLYTEQCDQQIWARLSPQPQGGQVLSMRNLSSGSYALKRQNSPICGTLSTPPPHPQPQPWQDPPIGNLCKHRDRNHKFTFLTFIWINLYQLYIWLFLCFLVFLVFYSSWTLASSVSLYGAVRPTDLGPALAPTPGGPGPVYAESKLGLICA